jgi:hypothetical protein
MDGAVAVAENNPRTFAPSVELSLNHLLAFLGFSPPLDLAHPLHHPKPLCGRISLCLLRRAPNNSTTLAQATSEYGPS